MENKITKKQLKYKEKIDAWDALVFFEIVALHVRGGGKARRQSWPEEAFIFCDIHYPHNDMTQAGQLCIRYYGWGRQNLRDELSFKVLDWNDAFLDVMMGDWILIDNNGKILSKSFIA